MSEPSASLNAALILALVGLLAASLVIPPLGAQEDEAAGRLLMAAQQQMRDGNLDAALEEYSELLSRFPESEAAPRALLDSASIHFRSGRLVQAEGLAQQVIEGHPSTIEGAEAEVMQARITRRGARSLDEVAEARTRLNRIPTLYDSDQFPALAARAEALLLGAQASATIGDDGAAVLGFLETLEDEPPGPWAAHARLGLARELLKKESWQAAAELLQEVVDRPSEPSPEFADGPSPAAEARILLTLLHRLWLRPLASEPRWQSSRRLPASNLKKPRGVAASADGTVAIADPAATSLLLVDGRTGNAQTTALSRSPSRPWFGPLGDGFLAILDGVQPLAAGRKQTFVLGGEKPKALTKIQAGATGLFGETLIIDREIEGLAVFDRDGLAKGLIGGRDSVDVACDRDGKVYILTRKPAKVSVYGADLQQILSFTPPASRPTAMDIDLLGNVYVLDESRGAIEVISREGAPIVTLGPLLPGGLELKGPEDIAVDGIGRIYVADAKLGSVLVIE